MDIFEILKSICEASYQNAYESETHTVIKKLMAELTDEIRSDALGNIICTVNKDGEGDTVFSAHMDKIAMLVTGIDKKTGMLKIDRSGSVDIRVLPASRVKVLGKKELTGCITSTPPHLTKGDKNTALPISELYVDCGLSFEEISEIVSLGDRIEYLCPVEKLLGDRASGAYMDNAAGCTAVILACEMLKKSGINKKVTAVFTTREETGKGGAQASFTALQPERALITDVSFGTAPGVPRECSSPLSSGTMICISPILQKDVSDMLISVAKKNNIPYTVEVMGARTMTDSDVAVTAGNGILTGLVSVPLINMHTPVETLDMKDIEAVAEIFFYTVKGE